MINKLRKKIFWIIQISLSIIIIGVSFLFITLSYKNTITSSKVFMDKLESRIIGKNSKSENYSESKTVKSIEGLYRVELINNNIVMESDNVTDEIKDYAVSVSNKKFEAGFIDKYIYQIIRMGNNAIEITLIESESTIKSFKTTIIILISIGIIGIFTIYVIATKISKAIVTPVEEAFEKQKQFISDASHELKTPIAVIEANADVLESKIGNNKWLTYIQNESQSMNKLVNDLLTLAKMENINISNNEKFDISKEVRMSVAVFESMIYEKKIELETNIKEGIEFNGDKEDIKHIISILLDNAIKHTEENKKIHINVTKEKNEIKIEVKNQGEPIPEQEREKIFERFYRIDKARNRNEKRYGLGLSIAKRIVDKYNGSIYAISKDGFTSFIVKM